MKVIKPSFKIEKIPKDLLKTIERIGRVCYKSEDKITEGSAEKFIEILIKRGHEAMLEHASFSVKFICDRGVSHELVRHRLFSFAQESTRYCNYSKDKFGGELTFIEPCFFEPGSMGYSMWEGAVSYAECIYLEMLDTYGVKPEEARSVLPNSLKTEIVVTGNLRQWRGFLKLRTQRDVHPQMLELTRPLLKELQATVPIVFDDITYS